MGGFVAYSSADGPAPGPEWLRDRLGIDYFDHVVAAYIVGDSSKDADLEQLQALRGLKTLFLLAPNVTDAGLEHVGRLRDLDMLWLGGPAITDAGFAQAEARQAVEHGLAQLPAHYRMALTLFYLQERRYDEIAEVMELPMGTVKTYLHRAKAQLREHLIELEAEP